MATRRTVEASHDGEEQVSDTDWQQVPYDAAPLLYDSPNDAFAMAATIYAEARGEPELGQIGVAHVILRRARARGVSIERVVWAPRQFSCWDGGRRMPRDRHARRAFARALRIADGVLSGALEDPTGGADHFHAVGASPSWAVGMRPHGVIGGHAFLGPRA